MNEKTLISIIVPCYNAADELERCVNSIRAQNHRELEIILVDDGSADGTFAVMKSLAKQDGRIKFIHKENGGVTSARFTGIQAAHGEWIGFVDADDEIERDMYARLLDNALSCGADIAHCGHRMIFPDGRVNYFYNTGVRIEQDRCRAITDLLEGTLIEPGLWNKLYSKKLFAGLEDWMDSSIKINEDLLMNYYLFSKAEKAVFEDFCPYHYIIREESASRRSLNEHRIYDPIKVKELILENASEEVRKTAEKAYISTCVNVYNTLTMTEKKEFLAEKKDVRQMIKAGADMVSLLSGRQRFSANLIRFAPHLHRAVYRLYAKKFQHDPYK